MALFFYNVTNEAGAVALIGRSLPRLTSDRAAQSLLISWVFVSLLQGVGGFGVPVAVVAPLLVGLGYTATQSVIMAALGHGWAVTFGSLGTSFVALTAVTGLAGESFGAGRGASPGLGRLLQWRLWSPSSAPAGSGFLRSLPMLLIVGAVMGLTQWWIATNGMWTLGSTSGALAGAVVGVIYVLSPLHSGQISTKRRTAGSDHPRSIALALAAYVILLLLAFSANLIDSVGTVSGCISRTS